LQARSARNRLNIDFSEVPKPLTIFGYKLNHTIKKTQTNISKILTYLVYPHYILEGSIMGKAIFYAIFATLFLWGGPKLTLYSFDLYEQGKASESWVPVKTQVTRFDIKSTSGSKSGLNKSGNSTTYVELAYNYSFNGVDYSGDRTGFGPYGRIERPNRKRIATVYVNPDSPSESVYVKGISKNNLGALAVGIGLILAGLYFLFLAIRSLLRR